MRHQFNDLLDTWLPGIAPLPGDARSQPESDQAEQNRLQNGFVVLIEGAVYERVAIEIALNLRRVV